MFISQLGNEYHCTPSKKSLIHVWSWMHSITWSVSQLGVCTLCAANKCHFKMAASTLCSRWLGQTQTKSQKQRCSNITAAMLSLPVIKIVPASIGLLHSYIWLWTSTKFSSMKHCTHFEITLFTTYKELTPHFHKCKSTLSGIFIGKQLLYYTMISSLSMISSVTNNGS